MLPEVLDWLSGLLGQCLPLPKRYRASEHRGKLEKLVPVHPLLQEKTGSGSSKNPDSNVPNPVWIRIWPDLKILDTVHPY